MTLIKIKRCTECDGTYPSVKFGVRKASPDGLNARCKSCINAMHLARSTRPEVQAAKRRYFRLHRARPCYSTPAAIEARRDYHRGWKRRRATRPAREATNSKAVSV